MIEKTIKLLDFVEVLNRWEQLQQRWLQSNYVESKVDHKVEKHNFADAVDDVGAVKIEKTNWLYTALIYKIDLDSHGVNRYAFQTWTKPE